MPLVVISLLRFEEQRQMRNWVCPMTDHQQPHPQRCENKMTGDVITLSKDEYERLAAYRKRVIPYMCPDEAKDWQVFFDLVETRTHSSATEPDANNLQTFPFSAVCCRKCSDHEPTCHDICGAYQTERDAAIREQAKREERERIAKQIEHNASNRKYHSYTTSMQIVEYLRGEQP